VRHQAATDAPLPAEPGITWLWAANGIFKRGADATLDLTVRVGAVAEVPGLARLLPCARFFPWPQRLPGSFLTPLLTDARRACARAGNGHGSPLLPAEKYYAIVWRDGLRLVAPKQDASAAHIRYQMPSGAILCDLHSHHGMEAYFSPTDNRDDMGLSVSCVVGTIYTTPTIVCRLNVYGHRQIVPAKLIFDSLGPFTDRYGETNAHPDH
jgi:hypothetical protein